MARAGIDAVTSAPRSLRQAGTAMHIDKNGRDACLAKSELSNRVKFTGRRNYSIAPFEHSDIAYRGKTAQLVS